MKLCSVERHGDRWIVWNKKEILGVADNMLAAYRLVEEAADVVQ